MRIFVAGATGTLGHPVVPLLVEAGHEVTAAGRTAEKRQSLEREGARAVEVDLFDPGGVRAAVSDHDVICNLATAVPRGARSFLPWSWLEMARIRRRVSANLVNGAPAGSTAPASTPLGDRVRGCGRPDDRAVAPGIESKAQAGHWLGAAIFHNARGNRRHRQAESSLSLTSPLLSLTR